MAIPSPAPQSWSSLRPVCAAQARHLVSVGRRGNVTVAARRQQPMAVRPDRAGTRGYFAPVSGATYVQLTTFRRDGRAVPTPVHLVVDGDAGFFRTWDVAGKAKRLRHTSAVRIAPATFRGRPLARRSRPRPGCWTAPPRNAPPACSPPGTRSCTDGSSPGCTAAAAGPPSNTGCRPTGIAPDPPWTGSDPGW